MNDKEPTQIKGLMLDYGNSAERLLTLLAEFHEKLEDAITLHQLAALTLDIHDTAQAVIILHKRIASLAKEKKQAA